MSIREISVDELAAVLDGAAETGPPVRLIDVRELREYVTGHVPGARLVVLGTVPDHVDAFAGEGPAYVICRTGARSGRACEFLAGQGVEAINVAGGTLAWMTSGRDVVAGEQAS
jgi:rhodanese-related sulfurtransferase